MSWIDEELKTVDLGDKRRDRRLGKILEDLTAQPGASGVAEYAVDLLKRKSRYKSVD